MPLIQSSQVSSAEGSVNIAIDDASRAIWTRCGVFCLAGAVGFFALWQLTIEIMRQPAPYFPTAPVNGSAKAAQYAGYVASIGWIRGDLWFDAASLLWSAKEEKAAGPPQATLTAARGAVIRAAELAPHDARSWLLLAKINKELELGSHRVAEALRMSYFTGPDDPALIPSRLAIAVQLPNIEDPDFRILVEGDVRSALRAANLRNAVIAAYRVASAPGKRFLEASVGDLDRSLANEMQPKPGIKR